MYIDPGAGSILLQVVGASVVAVAASFSRVRHAIGSFVRRIRRK